MPTCDYPIEEVWEKEDRRQRFRARVRACLETLVGLIFACAFAYVASAIIIAMGWNK